MAAVTAVDVLRARGMSPGALRHAVATGRLVRVRRGVYCDGEVWRASASSPAERHAIEVRAAWLALGRRGWASGYSAVLLAELPVPKGEPAAVTYSLPERAHGRRDYAGLRLRNASMAPEDVTLLRGVPSTVPGRAALDVAREHGFAAGLVVADAALRRGSVTADGLAAIVGRVGAWSGGRQARLVAEHADGARESPTESISYAHFVDAGLVLPECNAWVVGHGAGGVRVDFLWRRHRLVGEVDGRVKYTDPLWRPGSHVLVDEKVRQLRLEEVGFVVVRWMGAEAMYRPEVVLDRIVRQSRQAAERFGVPALALARQK